MVSHALTAARGRRPAHAFTVLTLWRSILTDKVSRRGYHLGGDDQTAYPVAGKTRRCVGRRPARTARGDYC
jgi:hypothetical protein